MEAGNHACLLHNYILLVNTLYPEKAINMNVDPEITNVQQAGAKGGIARARILTKERRKEIASKAAIARWQARRDRKGTDNNA
jgi:hypothetical protein